MFTFFPTSADCSVNGREANARTAAASRILVRNLLSLSQRLDEVFSLLNNTSLAHPYPSLVGKTRKSPAGYDVARISTSCAPSCTCSSRGGMAFGPARVSGDVGKCLAIMGFCPDLARSARL